MTILKLKNRPLLSTSFGPYFEKEFGYLNTPEFVPPTNILKATNQFEIRMAVPGYRKENFNISLDHDVLTVSVNIQKDHTETQDQPYSFLRKEFGNPDFSRRFTVPKNIFSDKISAKYENGILSVFVPFEDAEKSKISKSIQVN
jgi:HSP20 family protein